MNKNKKINKEKTLALVLAGGLVTSTLNVVNTSADMIQDVNLVESVSTSNESVIPNQTLNFDNMYLILFVFPCFSPLYKKPIINFLTIGFIFFYIIYLSDIFFAF